MICASKKIAKYLKLAYDSSKFIDIADDELADVILEPQNYNVNIIICLVSDFVSIGKKSASIREAISSTGSVIPIVVIAETSTLASSDKIPKRSNLTVLESRSKNSSVLKDLLNPFILQAESSSTVKKMDVFESNTEENNNNFVDVHQDVEQENRGTVEDSNSNESSTVPIKIATSAKSNIMDKVVGKTPEINRENKSVFSGVSSDKTKLTGLKTSFKTEPTATDSASITTKTEPEITDSAPITTKTEPKITDSAPITTKTEPVVTAPVPITTKTEPSPVAELVEYDTRVTQPLEEPLIVQPLLLDTPCHTPETQSKAAYIEEYVPTVEQASKFILSSENTLFNYPLVPHSSYKKLTFVTIEGSLEHLARKWGLL